MEGRVFTSLVLWLCLFLVACATVGPPQPPSLQLSKPATDLRATRKGNKVTLTWTIPTQTTDRETIRSRGPTRICRSLDAALNTCGIPVGEVSGGKPAGASVSSGSKISASYSDDILPGVGANNSAAQATYAVEVLNADGRSAGLSNRVKVSLAETLPAPRDFTAQVTAQGVAVSWTGQLLARTYPEPVRYVYSIYRRQEGSQQANLVGQVDVGGEAHPSLVDQSVEWEKTYYYRVTTITVVTQVGKPDLLIEGEDSPEVKVFADDVFPPAVPSGLQAVFSGPGQEAFIDLIWTPVSDVDLAGYFVYRREGGGAAVKLNADVVKAPAYRDASVVSGKSYAYSVSAVDVRGNESARSEEAGESVP